MRIGAMNLSPRELATLRAALEYWKEELSEGSEWLPDSLFFKNHSPLSPDEVDRLAERLGASEGEAPKQNPTASLLSASTRKRPRESANATERVKRLKLLVPTYNANYYPKQVNDGTKPEFGAPYLPVVVHSADGIRVVLGTHEFLDVDAPDIMIERQPRAWAIFLHPIGGGDPAGYVYFLDDGRSYLLKDRWIHDEEGIRVLEHDGRVPDIYADDSV
jgi:hypothetical protein